MFINEEVLDILNPTFAKGIRKNHNMKPLFFFLVVISLLGLEKTQASGIHTKLLHIVIPMLYI